MAIVINFAGASLRKPGAYSRIRIAQGGAAQAQLGVVALVGEADGGDPVASESGLSAVTFGPDQFTDIVNKFGSGSLVDSARFALAPSNDPQIVGGAQQLLLMKTNQSAKASVPVPTSYGTAYAKSAGQKGNNISLEIANSSGKRVITIANSLTGDKELSTAIGGVTVFTIQVAAATSATLTITATQLQVVAVGAGASSITIPLNQFNNIEQLVEYLSNQTGYTVTIGSNSQKASPLSVMDRVSAVDVKTAPYALKRDASDIRDFFADSGLVTFTPTLFVGLPAVLVKTFLTGGTLGATSNANIQDAFDRLLGGRVNFVVPLFSRDATDDIADLETDASSTYTVDSVHSITNTHCIQASTVKGKKERQGYVGFMGDYVDAQDAAANLGSSRVSLHLQQIDILDSLGNALVAQPHMLAVANAGMKAAAVVGLPNTFKLVNCSGFSVPNNDFDPETQADDAIQSNLTFIESSPGGGFRFVLDNNTYGQDLNAWILSRPAVLYAADTAAFAIRLNTETFVGQRNSDVTPETIKNLLVSVLDGLRSSGIIVPDKNTNGKGFKDLVVTIVGSVVNVSVTLALVEGLEFILNDIVVQRASF